MADEPRTVSRRERREAEAHPDAPTAMGGQPPTGEQPQTMGGQPPTGEQPQMMGGQPRTGEQPQMMGGQSPEIQAGYMFTSEMPTARVAAAAQPEPQDGTLSRRDRRRLERLEKPMETWTAEEEQRHTGQVPTMTPGVIAQQEALAQQRAAAAQQDAHLATGGTPLAAQGAAGAQQMGLEPATPGGVPPSLQHLFPPAALQGGAAVPQQEGQVPHPQPTQPSIDQHGRLVSPGGPQPFEVPSFADTQSGGAGATGFPPQGVPPVPQQYGAHAAAFEAMVSGAPLTAQGKPLTIQVPQVGGPLQPPGPYAPPGVDAYGAMPQGAGQALVVPGTGTLRSAMGTGTLRTVPGTGAIPRPIVEVQPAGGLRHFGWAHLSLLAAAAFALGLVVYTVAASQGN